MSAGKAQRRPKAPVLPLDAAIAQRSPEKLKALHFCENERDLPIAGTPEPKPCPFCGKVDCSIVFRDGPNISANVQCDNCGTEAPYACENEEEGIKGSYAVALRAARFWNERKGAA